MATIEEPTGVAARLRNTDESVDIRHRSAAITNEIVARIVRDVPAFKNAPPVFVQITRVVVARIVDLVLLLFLETRPAARREVSDLVAICVPPTDQGVTLEDMLLVFRAAQDELWDELRRLHDEGDLAAPGTALDLSQVGASVITELSRGVTAAYLRGDRVWLQRRDAEDALVSGLLATPPRIEEATRAARSLDLQVFGHWQCAAYQPVDGDDWDGLVEALDDARLTWGTRGALSVVGSAVVMAVQDSAPLPVPPGARVGIGTIGESALGFRTSHTEAVDSLTVATRAGAASLTAEQARLGRIVLGSLSPAVAADLVLAPLDAEPESRREMLFETLAAWLAAQGSPSSTAEALHLHVQSTRYRIEQLREVLGSEVLDDPEQRLLLSLAVAARRLSA